MSPWLVFPLMGTFDDVVYLEDPVIDPKFIVYMLKLQYNVISLTSSMDDDMSPELQQTNTHVSYVVLHPHVSCHLTARQSWGSSRVTCSTRFYIRNWMIYTIIVRRDVGYKNQHSKFASRSPQSAIMGVPRLSWVPISFKPSECHPYKDRKIKFQG